MLAAAFTYLAAALTAFLTLPALLEPERVEGEPAEHR